MMNDCRWFVARCPKDPEGSFTAFSTRPEDVARANPANLHPVECGCVPSVWAMMAYATSYEGVLVALDLLNSGGCS